MVENAVDRHRGEKSLGHAKLGVRLFKKTQLPNELGAEERDLAKYSIQIVRLLPSNDYVLGRGFLDLLHCRVIAGGWRSAPMIASKMPGMWSMISGRVMEAVLTAGLFRTRSTHDVVISSLCLSR